MGKTKERRDPATGKPIRRYDGPLGPRPTRPGPDGWIYVARTMPDEPVILVGAGLTEEAWAVDPTGRAWRAVR